MAIIIKDKNIDRFVLQNTDIGKIYLNDYIIFGGDAVMEYFYFEWDKNAPMPFANRDYYIELENNGGNNPDIEYSYDTNEWFTMGTTKLELKNIGDRVYFRGNNSNGFSKSDSIYTSFKTTTNVPFSTGEASNLVIGGNIMSLTSNDVTTIIPSDYCFYKLFNNSIVANSYELQLPATTLTNSCYYGMFYGCDKLTGVPTILPATTLADWCYISMFYGCTSLTQAPELPATTLKEWCYGSMFDGCTNLKYIKCLATDISADNCTTNWLYNVSSSGTFVKDASMNNWGRGDNGIPNNWTIEDN